MPKGSDVKLQVPHMHQLLAEHTKGAFREEWSVFFRSKDAAHCSRCTDQKLWSPTRPHVNPWALITLVLKMLFQTCPCSVCLPVRNYKVDRASWQPVLTLGAGDDINTPEFVLCCVTALHTLASPW